MAAREFAVPLVFPAQAGVSGPKSLGPGWLKGYSPCKRGIATDTRSVATISGVFLAGVEHIHDGDAVYRDAVDRQVVSRGANIP